MKDAFFIAAAASIFGFGLAYYIEIKFIKKHYSKIRKIFLRLALISFAVGVMFVSNEILGSIFLNLQLRQDKLVERLLVNIIILPIIFLAIGYLFKSSEQSENINANTNIESNHWIQADKEFNEYRDKALWIQMLAESDGNENVAKARYLKAVAKNLSAISYQNTSSHSSNPNSLIRQTNFDQEQQAHWNNFWIATFIVIALGAVIVYKNFDETKLENRSNSVSQGNFPSVPKDQVMPEPHKDTSNSSQDIARRISCALKFSDDERRFIEPYLGEVFPNSIAYDIEFEGKIFTIYATQSMTKQEVISILEKNVDKVKLICRW